MVNYSRRRPLAQNGCGDFVGCGVGIGATLGDLLGQRAQTSAGGQRTIGGSDETLVQKLS